MFNNTDVFIKIPTAKRYWEMFPKQSLTIRRDAIRRRDRGRLKEARLERRIGGLGGRC